MARQGQMFRYDETSQASEEVLIVSAASEWEQAAAGLARRSVTAAESSCIGHWKHGCCIFFQKSSSFPSSESLSLQYPIIVLHPKGQNGERRIKLRALASSACWGSYRAVPGHWGVYYHCHWLMTNVESLGHEAFLKPAETWLVVVTDSSQDYG